jgi:glucose-6-phosphate dehydrogenase-like protein
MNIQDAAAIVVIFGAAGDLTRRKLLDRQLPERFAILGLDRIALDDEAFRRQMREGVDQFSRRGRVSAEAWGRFAPASASPLPTSPISGDTSPSPIVWPRSSAAGAGKVPACSISPRRPP